MDYIVHGILQAILEWVAFHSLGDLPNPGIHLIRTDSNMLIFMAEQYFIVHMYHNFFIHRHQACFHVLAIVNSAAVNNGLHGYFSILVSSRYMPRSGIMVILFLVFSRNLHTIIHRGCINLHSHQQCRSILFSPQPFQHLFFVDILLMDILPGGR